MPPPIPAAPLVSPAGYNAAAISWRKVQNLTPGNQGQVTYLVFRDAVQVMNTRDSDVIESNLADGNTYVYTVAARDNSGTSVQSPGASVTLPALITASFDDGFIRVGLGNPNNRIMGSPGMLWCRTDGGAGATMYVKETGVNTKTGWAAK